MRELARRRAAIIVMTGEVDYISDGEAVYTVRNGHKYVGGVEGNADRQLEVITGSGCMTGTIVATFCAAARLKALKDGEKSNKAQLVVGDMLLGSLAGYD